MSRQPRTTRQRQTILEEICKMTSHPSADEVYEAVRRRLPHISLATVYRNLEVLAERGMIQKLEFGGFQRRFDGNAKNHFHIRCVSCGRIDDVMNEPMLRLEMKPRRMNRYEVLGYRLEFSGLCPKCRKKKTSSQRSKMMRKEKV